MASATRRISESEWESHRAEITKLYYDKQMTQKQVEKFMAEERDFVATKYQYENHFARWKLKKKHSKETWAALGQEIELEKGSPALTYHGRTIHAKKIKKATSRYRGLVPRQGPLSPGFELVDTVVTMAPVLQSVLRAELPSLRLTPSLYFLKQFHTSQKNTFQQSNILAILRGTIPPFRLLDRPSVDEDRDSATSAISISDSTTMHQVASTVSAEAMFPSSALESWQHNIDSLVSSPGSSAQISSYSNVDHGKLHLLVFAVTNNMIDRLGFSNLRDVWIYLRQTLTSSSGNVLLQMVRGSYSKSVWWKLLQGAIEAGDARGCAEVIRLGQIKVDDVVCREGYQGQFTAVELAVFLRHTDVLGILLDEGADPALTQSSTKSWFNASTWGALHLAIEESPHRFSPPHWRDCRLKDPLYQTASILLSTEAWAKTNCSVTLRIDLHYGSSLQDLENILDATTPHTPSELALAMIKSIVSHQFMRKYGSRDCVDFLLRLIELIVLNPRKSLPSVIPHHSPLPLCLGRELFGGRVVEPLQYFLNYIRSATYSLLTCPCGITLSDCLSTWFCQLSSPPTLIPICSQQSEKAKARLSVTEILEVIKNSQPLEQTKYCNLISYCDSDWDSLIVEDELLYRALETACGDLVQKLLTVRQTYLELEHWLSMVQIDNQHLVKYFLTTGFTNNILSYSSCTNESGFSLYDSTLEALVEHGFSFNGLTYNDCREDFRESASNGDYKMFRHYLELYPTMTIHCHMEVLCEGPEMENIDEVLKELFKHRPTRQALVNTSRVGRALVAAAECGCTDVAWELLTIGLSAHSAVPSAAAPGPCKHGFYEDEDKEEVEPATLLGLLIKCDQTPGNQICKLVINQLCEPAQVDRYADSKFNKSAGITRIKTPLLIAVEHGKLDIVQLLITEYKADINLPPRLGVQRTPLQQAAESGHLHIVRWLLDHGADVNGAINQFHGATALQLGAIGGYCGIMEVLINAGADLDAPGAISGGRTALEGAAEHGRLDAVNLLLGSGVKITGEREEILLSAIQYAKKNGHESIADLLGDYHIDVSLGTIELGDLGMGGGVFPEVFMS